MSTNPNEWQRLSEVRKNRLFSCVCNPGHFDMVDSEQKVFFLCRCRSLVAREYPLLYRVCRPKTQNSKKKRYTTSREQSKQKGSILLVLLVLHAIIYFVIGFQNFYVLRLKGPGYFKHINFQNFNVSARFF